MTEMLWPNQNTQNVTEGGQSQDINPQIKRLDKMEAALQQVSSQQAINQSNLRELGGMLSTTNLNISQLLTASQLPQPSSAPVQNTAVTTNLISSETTIKPSEFFSGDADQYGGFILQCHLAFSRVPQTYASDAAKITFIISQLKREALRWVNAHLSSHSLNSLTFSDFLQDFSLVFDHPLQQEKVVKRLLNLQQGKKSMSEHASISTLQLLRQAGERSLSKVPF